MGSGMWALGVAFSNSGMVFGVPLLIAISMIYNYCINILVQTSRGLCKELKVGSLTYPETIEKVFECGPEPLRKYSKAARYFMDVGMFFGILGGSIQVLLIASTFQEIFNHTFEIEWSIRTYILLSIVPILFLSQIRELKHLAPLSAIGNLLTLSALFITFYYIFKEPLVFDDKPFIASIENWPSAITTMIFTVSNIRITISVENKMAEPHRYLGITGVLNVFCCFIAFFYTFLGFFSYVRFGQDIKGSVTLNLPMEETAAVIAKIFIGLSSKVSIGLITYICTEVVWKEIKKKVPKEKRNFVQVILRALIGLSMVFSAFVIPDLKIAISIVATLFNSMLIILVPAVSEMIFLYQRGYGRYKWKLIVEVLLICLYLLVVTSSMYRTIMEIIEG
jgi:proton-coupled amino acid transporter